MQNTTDIWDYGLSVAGGQKTTFGFSFISAVDVPCDLAGKSA
jgi:hypothetical protein